MDQAPLIQRAPIRADAARALSERQGYDQWPEALKDEHARARRGAVRELIRFQLIIGAIVAGVTLLWDLYAVPGMFEVALGWRLLTILPLSCAGFMLLRRGRLQEAKVAMGAAIVCLGIIAMYLGGFGSEALTVRYTMATAFLLGIACFALPYTPQELSQFALSYVLLTTLAAMWPHPIPPVEIFLHITFCGIIGATSWAIARNYWEIDARSFLTDLRANETREELKQNNELLRQLSEQDPLTGLANRRHFENVLEQKVSGLPHEQCEAELVAVLMIDLDHFKAFNDRHGHQAGDRCLKLVAQALKSLFPADYGVLARFGGEEFIAALRERSPGEAEELAEAMREAIEALFDPNHKEPRPLVTASIGLALGPAESSLNTDDLIEMADVALYSAKRGGRNRVEVIEATSPKRRTA